MNQTSEFINTKEYSRFAEFCNACKKEKYIGLCYGPAGVGKSMAARHFAKWAEVMKEMKFKDRNLFDYSPTAILKTLDTIVYVPPVSIAPMAINKAIQNLWIEFDILVIDSFKHDPNDPNDTNIERGKSRVKLVIIDEADRLQPKCLEQIRDIYDRYNIAVILIGMPGIEKRLIRFPQLYSRIGFAHVYKPLSKEEISFIIQNHLHVLDASLNMNNFSDQEAIAAFARITKGNFRLINRLLKQTIRIMMVNQLSNITKEIIETARECLVIGNVD